MADGEEPVTSVEQPAPSPVPAEPSEQAAETPAEESPAPSEQPPETPAEQVAGPDAETQRLESLVDELVAAETTAPPDETPAGADEVVTKTRKEYEAELFRAKQSGEDSASRRLAETQAQQHARQQAEAQEDAQMKGEIEGLLQGYTNRGEEIPADFADRVLQRGAQRHYNTGVSYTTQRFAAAAWRALGLKGDEPQEVVAPLYATDRTPEGVMQGMVETARNLARLDMDAEVDKRAKAEIAKQVPVLASALAKKALLKVRSVQPNGDVPDGSPSSGLSEFQELQKRLVDGEILTPEERAKYRRLEPQTYG